MILDNVYYGDAVLEAVAEIKPDKLAEPGNIALEDVGIKTVLLKHRIDKLLRRLCTRGRYGRQLLSNEVNGHASDKNVDYQRNAEKYKYGLCKSFDYIL